MQSLLVHKMEPLTFNFKSKLINLNGENFKEDWFVGSFSKLICNEVNLKFKGLFISKVYVN